MNYSSFLDQILALVQDRLPDGCRAEFRTISKNNGVAYTGMCLSSDSGGSASPLIYMEPYFARLTDEELPEWESGEVLQDIVSEITEILCRPVPQALDPLVLTDRDYVLKNVVFRLVNFERNEELLPELLNRRFLDLAVTYGIYIHSPETGNGITMVRKNMAESMDITEQELFEAASINTPRILGEELRSMSELLGVTGDTTQDRMYVLSNREAFYGAGVLLYGSKLNGVAAGLDTDLYILPSSVHEVILTPKNETDAAFLSSLVREVNEREVRREDVLSDSVYVYDRAENRIRLA